MKLKKDPLGLFPHAGQQQSAAPLRRRVILFISGIVILQILLFVSAVFLTKTPERLDESAIRILQNTVKTTGSKLESQMASWTEISSYEADMNEIIDLAVTQTSLQRSDVRTNEQLRSEILEQSADTVLASLRSSGATDCFVILENEEQSEKKDALALRDLNPEDISASNHDILVEAGSNSLMFDQGFTLDSYWSEKLNVTSDADYYYTSYEAGNTYTNLNAVDLGYFSRVFRTRTNDIQMISYTIPLLDENHESIGVIGFGISLEYLQKLIPGNEINIGDGGVYYLGITTNNSSFETITASDAAFNSALLEDKQVEITSIAENKNLFRFSLGSDSTKYQCSIYPLHLYNSHTPFENQQWTLCGVLPQNMLHAASDRLISMLCFSLLLSFLISMLFAFLIANNFIKPIGTLLEGVRRISPTNSRLPATNIQEFDELAHAIERQSEAVFRAGSKTSDIIEMAGINLGVYEYSEEQNMIYCTKRIFEMFEIPDIGWKDNYIDKQNFFSLMEYVDSHLTKEEEEQDIYCYVSDQGNTKWLEMKRVSDSRSSMCVVSDVSDSMIDKKRIQKDRDFDVLTNLYNRRAFAKKVSGLLESKNCTNGLISMWDLDNLKYVNDTFGHDMGDKYICLMAQTFRKIKHKKRVISRLSGDEFAVFLYNGDLKELTADLQEIHKCFVHEKLPLPDGNYLNVSASAGIAYYDKDGKNYKELMGYADFAMYEVKKSSKGDINLFNREAYVKDYLLVKGVGELNRIIAEESVRYVFQPIFDLKSGEVTAYEALIRPVSNMVATPSELIRLAQSQSKLGQIERLTWLHALKDFFAQSPNGDERLLFVNSIPNQCLSQSEIDEISQQYGSKLSRVVIESTELTQVDEDMEKVKLDWCRQMDLHMALDDYGNGNSNQKQLINNKFDFIKLDISLVKDIHLSDNTQKLVGATIAYCHERHLMVIAEGIETKEELDMVTSLGADYGQGFYLGKPDYKLDSKKKFL